MVAPRNLTLALQPHPRPMGTLWEPLWTPWDLLALTLLEANSAACSLSAALLSESAPTMLAKPLPPRLDARTSGGPFPWSTRSNAEEESGGLHQQQKRSKVTQKWRES